MWMHGVRSALVTTPRAWTGEYKLLDRERELIEEAAASGDAGADDVGGANDADVPERDERTGEPLYVPARENMRRKDLRVNARKCDQRPCDCVGFCCGDHSRTRESSRSHVRRAHSRRASTTSSASRSRCTGF